MDDHSPLLIQNSKIKKERRVELEEENFKLRKEYDELRSSAYEVVAKIKSDEPI